MRDLRIWINTPKPMIRRARVNYFRATMQTAVVLSILCLNSMVTGQTQPATTETSPTPAAVPTPADKLTAAPAIDPKPIVGISLRVSDESGKPLAGASFHFNGRVNRKRFDKKLKTDETGIASVPIATDSKVDYLWMTCGKVGYVPIHHTWRSDSSPIAMPRELNLQLVPGKTIHGIVKNEAGEPIEKATVEISMPITWPKLASYVFTAAELKTDAEGRWQWNGAPAAGSELSVRVSHRDYLKSWGERGTEEQVTILKRGLIVTGIVTDSSGNPVRGATARLGFDRFGTDEPTGETDSQGRFNLINCKPGKSLVTIQTNGFAPLFLEVTVGEKNPEMSFKLEPGHTMRVRIVDPQGKPIKGATFCTDTWRGYRSLELRKQADAEGRVWWKSAPADTVLCDTFHQGYISSRRVPVKAGEVETVITLHPELVITGNVTDAQTGKPIPKFSIRNGYILRNSDRFYWSRDEGPSFSDGKYSFKFDEPSEAYALQFIAPGYLPAESRQFRLDEGKQTFDIQLQPGNGPTGTVLLPSGKSAAGAQVGVATQEQHAYLSNGQFHRSGNSAELVTADDQGTFQLTPSKEPQFLLIVTHDGGYAEVLSDQFSKDNQIKLEAWGRIEGRVMQGSKPDANRDVSFWPERDGARHNFIFTNDYRAKTDAEGRFQFDRVIPGPGIVSRVVVTQFIKSSQHAPCWQTAVDVRPTETAIVTVGGSGRPVIGQLKFDREPDFAQDWTSNEPASISPVRSKGDQKDAFSVRYMAGIAQDGKFSIPDVPAGDYELTVPVNNPPVPNACGAGTAIGQAKLKFTVPPMPAERSDEPLDLGTVTATLFDTLDVGEEAPLFVLSGLSGGSVRLSDFRGKLVLLDFWATWCQPCLAEMPTLQELQKEFAENPRFALIGMACDNEPESAKKYADEKELTWTHAHSGFQGSATATKYTVRSIPATFLIGPDGRVLAKNLLGEELKRAVAAALADDKLFEAAKSAAPPVRFPVVRFGEPKDAPKLPAKPAALVMDDRDPDYEKDHIPTDAISLYSDSGEPLWTISGLNNCQSVGGSHRIAIDRTRERIYFCEAVANRITAIKFAGNKIWQVDSIESDTLAIDEKTGNLWSSGGESLVRGETVVFDPDGNEIAAFPFRGIDIVYDSYSDKFWLAGYEILQVDRHGQIQFRIPVNGNGTWCTPSISINPKDGTAWVGERDHPDVVGSENRLWKIDAQGKVQKTALGEIDPFLVTNDPTTGDAWLCFRGLHRTSAAGPAKEMSPIKATYISASSNGTDLWATTEDSLLKLDAQGKEVSRRALAKPSQQIWLLAF